jgi:hypothetical protein
MAGGPRLDGAGMAKMKTLDDALLLLQRVNGLVEQYAMAIKRNQPSGPFVQNIRRTLPSLAENLKGQFGMIAEQVMAVNLSAGRGASEVVRVRQLREGVAQIKQALDIAFAQTKDRHAMKDAEHGSEHGTKHRSEHDEPRSGGES